MVESIFFHSFKTFFYFTSTTCFFILFLIFCFQYAGMFLSHATRPPNLFLIHLSTCACSLVVVCVLLFPKINAQTKEKKKEKKPTSTYRHFFFFSLLFSLRTKCCTSFSFLSVFAFSHRGFIELFFTTCFVLLLCVCMVNTSKLSYSIFSF